MKDGPESMDYRSLLETAFLELREMRSELESAERAGREPIAIVGMGCRLPSISNPMAFWQLLCEGRSVIREVPAERWNVDEIFAGDAGSVGRTPHRWGGFLEDLERFDAAFFGISAREAPNVDPRQRLILEVAWEALEDAGILPESLSGSRTGVYIATLSNDYNTLFSQNYQLQNSFSGAGTANSIIANRVSYFLDLHGPSLTLDTACSGSLLAIELACRSLRSGESTLALAGGVSINLLPNGDLFFARAGALSPDGRCQAFDSGANGIVRSEGAGVIVLKPLAQAVAAGDRIYALIRGGAINHNGRSNGIMAPHGLAQEALLREAYERAGVSPGKVQYVEAHGTGTRLGDPIEANSLATVLGTERADGRACALGSVKTNVGHLEAAAGVIGIIKTSLALHQRLIPPTLHLKELNPLIRATDFPLHIPQQLERWPIEDEPLIAGVSSFGFGGANVHLVLEEGPRDARPQPPAEAPYLLPLSASSAAALRAVAESYQRFLADDEAAQSLADICYTASLRRGFQDHRLAVTGHSRAELISELEAFMRGEKTPNTSHGVVTRDEPAQLVFVFSGQGTHRSGMGLELMEREPVFRQTIEECERLLGQYVEWSLVEQLSAREDESRLHETDVSQPALFAVQVALAALWRSWGILPGLIVGQSLGELAAAHVAGALSLEDAVRVVFHRSRLMKRMAGLGRTAVVGLNSQQTQLALADFVDTLAVAGSIGPTSSVISGEPNALEDVLRSLRSRDVFCRLLENGDLAFHSPQMNGIKAELMQAIEGIRPMSNSVPFISTVTGTLLEGGMLDAVYWGRNLREPFCFADVITNLIKDGHSRFLEISPHPVMLSSIQQCLIHQEREGVALPTLVRDREEKLSMLSSLGGLYAQGHSVEWNSLSPSGGRCVSLPTRQWQRERHWYDQLEGARVSGRSFSGPGRKARSHPLLGERWHSALDAGQQFWETTLSLNSLAYVKDHSLAGVVLLPGSAYLEMALAAAAQTFGEGAHVIEDVRFERALMLFENDELNLQLVFTPGATGEAFFKIYSRPSSADNLSSSWTLHASGKLRHLPTDVPAKVPSAVSLEALRASCLQTVSPDEHYAAMQARQLRYGPGFRAVAELRRREGESLSLCELPEGLQEGIAGYQIHPVLLDAAFQTVAASLPEEGQDLYLPQGVLSLRLHHRPGARAWCHARLRPGARAGANLLQADLTLFDDEGRVTVEVLGVSLRRLDDAQRVRLDDPKEWLYEVQWQPQASIAPQHKLMDQPATYLVFTDGGEMSEKLTSLIEADGHVCVRVYVAQRYRLSEDRRSCWLDPLDPQHFQRLFHEVLTDNLPPCRAVIHLWSLNASLSEEATRAELEMAQSLGCESVLHIAQSLTATEGRGDARVWVVTARAQVSGVESDAAFAQSALWGMGRVLAVEQPELWGGLVDLDLEDAERDARLLYQELSESSAEREALYRAGQRHVARLRRTRPDAAASPYTFRADASYLITGGMSGLGLETARWMVRRGARRILLLGRTPLPPRSLWTEMAQEGTAEGQRVAAILDLERMGASVHVCAVDVADETQLGEFLDQYRREGWPPLRGVVHAAGLIKDQLLMRMDLGAFREVLKPKLYGSWLLHSLTLRDELDFFVMFSSATSVLGRAGQANYAAANAFMDGLAHYRKRMGLPALSINWGPWSEVGMYARAGLFEGSTSRSVENINPEQGAELLSLLVGKQAGALMVINADWTRFKAQPMLAELVSERRADAPSVDNEGAFESLAFEMLLAGEAGRRAMLEEYLKKAIGRVLRCEAGSVSRNSALVSLGMDSIMAVELKNSIEAELNLSVSLADLFTGSVVRLVENLDMQLRGDEQLASALAEIEHLSIDEVLAQLDGEDDGEQTR
jgi:myxalamid-type polyketide synthase MxaE and MxaD